METKDSEDTKDTSKTMQVAITPKTEVNKESAWL